MILKIIGVCWMVGPVFIFFVPNSNVGELLPYAATSFILGFLLFKAVPKNQKKASETRIENKESNSPQNVSITGDDRFDNNIESTTDRSNSYISRFENEDHNNYVPEEIKPIGDIQNNESNNINNASKPISSEHKYVEYNLNFKDINNVYPMVKFPLYKTIVRTHRYGRINRRGYKEEAFQKLLEFYLSKYFEISGRVVINTGSNTRPYEPDIALIGYSKYNTRIDIEIDEPYAGITRKPTHCKGEDFHRDNYFKERGWIVLRFSEYQVHIQPFECLNIIYRLVKTIDKTILIEELEESAEIKREKSWTLLQAQEWEKIDFRENYLNHQFEVLAENTLNYERCLNSQEIREEALVKTKYTEKEEKGLLIGFNGTNSHKRDANIKFYPNEHIYKVNGVEFKSVSTIISSFFPEFNPLQAAANLNVNHRLYGKEIPEIVKIWKEEGEQAALEGTILHIQIEKYFLRQEYERTEGFHHFENFINEHNFLDPYRSEWRIFDADYNIAGTIDLLVKDENEYDIYDWKRSKKIVNEKGELKKFNKYQQGIGFLKHLDDTSYNRYCLQQSLYKYILEKNYGLSIRDMYLIVLYPNYKKYYKVKVPYLKEEVIKVLSSL